MGVTEQSCSRNHPDPRASFHHNHSTSSRTAIMADMDNQDKSEKPVISEVFLRRAFRGYDSDGDGSISTAEFVAAMKRWTKCSDSDIEEILKKGDLNDDGSISYSEFTKMMQ